MSPDRATGAFTPPSWHLAVGGSGERADVPVAKPGKEPRSRRWGPIPVGAAVHTGDAFVGSTAAGGAVNDFTALGDVVNTTARLAGEAAAGELLVSITAAAAAGLGSASLEHRTLNVRGRSDPIEVVALTSSRTPG